MPKLEKKILLWVEKNMFLLILLLALALGLYLRRTAIWWGSPDINYYFDIHENNIQSSFYYLLLVLVQHLPLLPLHSVKWLAVLADYVVAALCFVAVGGHREKLGVKNTFLVVVCILSPLVFLRGACWGQIDSLAFAFLLGGYLLWEKGKKAAGMVLAALGAALYPCFFLLVLGWWLYRGKERQGKDGLYLGAFVVILCLLEGASALLLGNSWQNGLLSCIRWMSFDPYEGIVYREALPWIKQMVNLLGYGAAMVSGIAVCRRKIPYAAVLMIHLAVLLTYGSLLFPEAI